MSKLNPVFAALRVVNPLWSEVAKPFTIDPETAYVLDGQPLGAFFLTKGLACSVLGVNVVGFASSGDVIGYHALLHGMSTPIQVIAQTMTIGFKVIPRAGLQIVQGCALSKTILDQYAYLMTIEGAIETAVAAEKAERRIAFRLLDYMDRFEHHEIPFSHADLAHYIGNVRRPTVSVVLTEWMSQGIIEQVERGLIRVRRDDLLTEIAGPAITTLLEQRGRFSGFLQEITAGA